MTIVRNLYRDIPAALPIESFEPLLQTGAFRLERIVSRGHATPEGEWYDEEQAEWVLLLQGSAGLRIEGRAEVIALEPGDYLSIPAHTRHRVEWTDPERDTVWLALHHEA
jgi:cupin 2 domain-containing protein